MKILRLAILFVQLLIADIVCQEQEEIFFDVFVVDSSTTYVTSKSTPILTYPSDIVTAIYKTTDGGNNWKRIEVNISDYINNIYFTSQDTGYITSYYSCKLYKTVNGGETWDSINVFQNEIRDMKFLNSKIGFIVGVYFGENIYKTIDGGNSWEPHYSGSNQFVGTTLSLVDSNIVYASNWYSDISKSKDSGNTWINMGNVIPGVLISVGQMQFVDENIGFISGSGVHHSNQNQNYPIFLSTSNGGINWDINYFIENKSISDYEFFNNHDGTLLSAGHIYQTTDRFITKDSIELEITRFDFADENYSIGINSKEIYKTSDGWKTFSKLLTLTNIENNNNLIKNKLVLNQNYPNPFNPTTTISYSMNQSGKVDLTLFNILGIKIRTLVSEFRNPGNYKYKLDMSGLSSGVYIYKLRIGANKLSKKMMYLK